MKIQHLLCITTMFTALACGGDDGNDDGAGTGDTDATATDPTATDPTATDPTATDPTATDPTATDPTATDPTVTATDPTAESSSGDATADSGSSGPDTLDSSGSDSGTSGGDISPECQTYCDLYLENCDAGQGGSVPYADINECAAACAGFSAEGLMCRTGHLDGTATGMTPDEEYYNSHCPHGSASGGGVCND